MLIDDVEFFSTMRSVFGYKGPHHVLKEVFSLASNLQPNLSASVTH